MDLDGPAKITNVSIPLGSNNAGEENLQPPSGKINAIYTCLRFTSD